MACCVVWQESSIDEYVIAQMRVYIVDGHFEMRCFLNSFSKSPEKSELYGIMVWSQDFPRAKLWPGGHARRSSRPSC
jgi:hypothetical protein